MGKYADEDSEDDEEEEDDDDDDDEDDDEDEDEEDGEDEAAIAAEKLRKEAAVREDITSLTEVFAYIDRTAAKMKEKMRMEAHLEAVSAEKERLGDCVEGLTSKLASLEAQIQKLMEMQAQPQPQQPPQPQPQYKPSEPEYSPPPAPRPAPAKKPQRRQYEEEDNEDEFDYDDDDDDGDFVVERQRGALSWQDYENMSEAQRAKLLEQAISTLGRGGGDGRKSSPGRRRRR